MKFLQLLLAGLMLLTFSTSALAVGNGGDERRIALVLGNGSYGNKIGDLANPPNDARLMAKTLRQLGFDVIERIDANQKDMKRAIKAFGYRLSEAGKDAVGLFYFAGHGVQVGGINYMIPSNADIIDESDVSIEAISSNEVQGKMAYAGNRLNIIIMDACRNNPFKRGFRSVSRGLARMDATKGTLIAYATSPGDVAADGASANSPYTEALARNMMTSGITVERMFKEVRNQVVALTNSRQVPWESSSLTGADFYFRAAPEGASTPIAAPQPVMSPDMLAWQSIEKSKNSGVIKSFITSFPRSPFVGMARARLEQLASLRPQRQPERKSRKGSSTAQMIQNLLGAALEEAELVEDLNDRVQILKNIARNQHAAGKRKQSNKTFQVAIRAAMSQPDKKKRVSLLRGIELIAIELGDIAAAQSIISNIKQSDDYFSYVITDISIAQARAGDNAGALRSLKRIKNEEKRNSTMTQTIVGLVRTGHIVAALKIVNRMEEEPRRTALGTIAKHQAEAGDIKGAFISLKGIVERVRPFYMDVIARVQLKAGDKQGAFQTMRHAVELQNKYNDDVWNGANNLAGLAVDQAEIGDVEGARRTIKQALSASSDSWPRHKTAIAQAKAGDISDALATLRKISDDDSRDYGYQGVAVAQAERGEFVDAVQTTMQIKDKKKRVSGFVSLVSIMAKAGKFEQAHKAAKNISDQQQLNRPLYDIANAQVKAGKLNDALKTAQGISSNGPYQFLALNNIIAAEIKRGSMPQALAVATLFSGDKNKGNAYYQIVEAWLKLNNITAALNTMAKIPKNTSYAVQAAGLIAKAQAKPERERRKLERSKPFDADKVFETEKEQDAYYNSFAISFAQQGDFAQSLRITNRIQSSKFRANALNGIINQLIKK